MIEAFPAEDTELELPRGDLGVTSISGFLITKLNPDGFTLEFFFDDPLKVSTGVKPDIMFL